MSPAESPVAGAVCPCKVCSGGWLVKTRLDRYTPPVVMLGWLYILGSVLFLVGTAVSFAVSDHVGELRKDHDRIHLGLQVLLSFVYPLPALTVGAFLVQTKRVLRCDTCGAVVPTS
jgi:hypothetical protein